MFLKVQELWPINNILPRTDNSTVNQRTSGLVNTHLTLGPGIYFNAFIHVYSPWARGDNPLVTNADVNRKPLSLPICCKF